MPAVREASTQVRYYQPQGGFQAPEWLKWGLIGAGVWVGYDIYKNHTLPGPLESVVQRLTGQSTTTGGTVSGSPTQGGTGSGTTATLTKAQQVAKARFPKVPLQLTTHGQAGYFYAGPYPGKPGWVGIAQYSTAGALVQVYPQKYAATLEKTIGSVASGAYKAPGTYTINTTLVAQGG